MDAMHPHFHTYCKEHTGSCGIGGYAININGVIEAADFQLGMYYDGSIEM